MTWFMMKSSKFLVKNFYFSVISCSHLDTKEKRRFNPTKLNQSSPINFISVGIEVAGGLLFEKLKIGAQYRDKRSQSTIFRSKTYKTRMLITLHHIPDSAIWIKSLSAVHNQHVTLYKWMSSLLYSKACLLNKKEKKSAQQ